MPHTPVSPRIFISSTTGALDEYRDAAVDVCRRLGFTPVYMESFVAERPPPVEVCRRKLDECDVLVLLVAHRYGARPPGVAKSYTELEYEWALAQSTMPLVPFVVDQDFPWPPREIDRDPEDVAALRSFLARVRAHHIRTFGDLNAFREDLFVALKDAPSRGDESGEELAERRIPAPPAFVASPPYTGSAPFTGRSTDLAELDLWARSEDPVMVLEAVGGTGKSALTWNWADTRALEVVPDLAGRFWWSFYEGSASIRRFLTEVLAYMQQRPLREVERLSRADLAAAVLSELRQRPYLLVLDGFERLLAAYHRFDPTKVGDDVEPSKRALIEPDADSLVRELVAARPSKVLISTRLLPEALERYGRVLPGVRHQRLPGLTDADTAMLVRRLGVCGDREGIARFFRQLGNHPLLIGIVAGLVRDYRPRPGHFDRWLEDPLAGGHLSLPELDLTQRRHHILEAALDGLPDDHARVLGWLSVFTGAVPWSTLDSINPLRPDPPHDDPPAPRAGARLVAALSDLEDRGLLWWDREANTYDLHPIVRAYAFQGLQEGDRVTVNERVRRHFEALPPEDVETAASVEDLGRTIAIFRALVGSGRFGEASTLWERRLWNPLCVRIAAHATVIELLTPLRETGSRWVKRDLASALYYCQRFDDATLIETSVLGKALEDRNGLNVAISLSRQSLNFSQTGELIAATRCVALLTDLNNVAEQDPGALAIRRAGLATRTGDVELARRSLDEAQRRGTKATNPWFEGDVETTRLQLDLYEGKLDEHRLDGLESQLTKWGNRRSLVSLRRAALVHKRDFERALEVHHEAERLARNAGVPVATAYRAFLLAQVGRDEDAASAVEDALSTLPALHEASRPHDVLARALMALGRTDEARTHAVAAYTQAWADGPPHAFYWELQEARALLDELGLEEPRLPTVDPATVRIPHETETRAFIAELAKRTTTS